MSLRAVLCVLLALTGIPAAPALAAGQENVSTVLRQRVDQIRAAGSLRIEGSTVRYSAVLADFHAGSRYAPAWIDLPSARELIDAIQLAAADGLDPAAYHLHAIRQLEMAVPTASAQADLDILRTDAFLRLAHDLRFGKVDPTDPEAGRDLGRLAGAGVTAETVRRGIADSRLLEMLEELRPGHFVYTGLVEALADLRRVAAAGGWETIPAGPTLRLGDADARVPGLRRRLVAYGADRAAEGGSAILDANLEGALRAFQRRHGLNPDGVLGRATLAELNVPVESRIEQVRVNLERARWITPDLPGTFVMVNVAGAMVYYVRNGIPVFESRTIVGRTATRTPVFRATMRYIELNPTWTVPPGIVGEVLAEIRGDAGYLQKVEMRVLDRSGREVEVSTPELGRLSARDFPYVFRQDPGPLNPLGQIKFVFPNSYNVYLHDTPSIHLFEREQRTFSHGCIRVHDPLGLAEAILDDPTWSRTRLASAIAPGRTRTITLPTPLPVVIQYWTAAADPHGEMRFYRDVYGRDRAVLRGLERPS